jgi:hypothetical protein
VLKGAGATPRMREQDECHLAILISGTARLVENRYNIFSILNMYSITTAGTLGLMRLLFELRRVAL